MISSASPRRAVLFVGLRRAALEAARALDLDVVCVAEKNPGPTNAELITAFLPCRFHDPALDWDALARRVGDARPIAAVFALTEQAVLPAARLRERLGFTADGPDMARRATDKLEMKRAVNAAGLRTAPFIDASAGLNADQLVAELGLPLVYKGRSSSGGRQNRIYRERAEIRRRLPVGWMAEGFVEGTEMSVEGLVAGGRTVFVNPTEYFRVRWANILPAALDEATRASVVELHRRAVAALGIDTAFTHLELFLTPEGPVFSEIAARPPGGHITELIELAYGFDPWRAWLRLGLGEEIEPPPAPRQTAGVFILHPGEGKVESVSGVEMARCRPGIERAGVTVEKGSPVAERVGSGQEVGSLVAVGRHRDEVAERLLAARREVRIVMAGEENHKSTTRVNIRSRNDPK